MDIVAIPFHDWKKVQREGGRTRDAHLIRHLGEHPDIDRILIINRPTSAAEMLAKGVWWKTRGEVIESRPGSRLVHIDRKLFALDCFDPSFVGPALRGKNWFFSAYGSARLLREFTRYRDVLSLADFVQLSFNVYAAKLFVRLPGIVRVFDAWDNFLRFPRNNGSRGALEKAYQRYARAAHAWTTNSEENRSYYKKHFDVARCGVIKNGVDVDTFGREYAMPPDLARLKRPIVGMGLKVTHLLDTDLLNYLTLHNPDLTFVLVGQKLDKRVFGQIQQRENFHYLGDKHYDEYPAYVRNFDACLIPYKTGDGQHGGDAIKFYEYLAADRPVVSTKGNGVTNGFGGVWLTDDAYEFSSALRQAVAARNLHRQLPHELTWSHKAEELVRSFRLVWEQPSCEPITETAE